jgi:CheY-like chemotaxis protein
MTKILLVDDGKFLRMATERALARAGYVVITAGDGPKAIELAKSGNPDVILLDMLLPGMSGPDVLMALKKIPRRLGFPWWRSRGSRRRRRCGYRRMERAHSWRNRRWNWIRDATRC